MECTNHSLLDRTQAKSKKGLQRIRINEMHDIGINPLGDPTYLAKPHEVARGITMRRCPFRLEKLCPRNLKALGCNHRYANAFGVDPGDPSYIGKMVALGAIIDQQDGFHIINLSFLERTENLLCSPSSK